MTLGDQQAPQPRQHRSLFEMYGVYVTITTETPHIYPDRRPAQPRLDAGLSCAGNDLSGAYSTARIRRGAPQQPERGGLTRPHAKAIPMPTN